MSKLVFDAEGTRKFRLGVDKVALFLANASGYEKGVAWNGVSKISNSPGGADEQKVYADNIEYASFRGQETYGGTIECYTFPDEFYECDGYETVAKGVRASQQKRRRFGLVWRTKIGNDTEGIDLGYEYHMAWNCSANPASKDNDTVGENPEAASMSYEFTTTPIVMPGILKKPTSTFVISQLDCDAAEWKAFEDLVYGTANAEPTMPSYDNMFGTNGVFVKSRAAIIKAAA